MYSTEKNVQILIALMKKHHIKKVIISPGSANLSFVASVQSDSFFELYSAVDERSAAYMACVLSEESGECVAISCTGATASRNYLPALTEAFYRKIPILAITSTRKPSMIGQNVDQVIDRTQIQHDVAKYSVTLPVVENEDDLWECNIKVNTALLELNHHGKGPVHINLVTSYNTDFSAEILPETRMIFRNYDCKNCSIPNDAKVAIFVGAHSKWDEQLTNAVDTFCEKYNAFVICDQTSNYKGKYGICFGLLNYQEDLELLKESMDVLIHIGHISAIWPLNSKTIWRVNEDGCVRDTYRKLTNVFEMQEIAFFEEMNSQRNNTDLSHYQYIYSLYQAVYKTLIESMETISFSSLWIAAKSHLLLPKYSVIHFGILNSLRCWNCFELNKTIAGYSNVGGFGIDGCISMIGAAISQPDRLFFGVFGDLAFFYDMNSLGNRHIGKNIRIMLINNGLGVEFKRFDINVQKAGLGDKANAFVSAEGHFGRKSKSLVKHYAEDLGFIYISASSKKEYEDAVPIFFNEEISTSILFEVFIDEHEDANALIQFRKMVPTEYKSPNSGLNLAKKIARTFFRTKD